MFDELEKKENNGNSQEAAKPAPVLPMAEPEINGSRLTPPKTSAARLNPLVGFEERLKKLEIKGRKRGKRYSIIGLIYSVIICTAVIVSGYYIIQEINEFSAQTQAIIVGLSNNNQPDTHRPKIKAVWRTCAQDSDCVETKRECCLCDAGGRQSAINKLYLPEWDNSAAEKCIGRTCSGEDNCISGRAICAGGSCIFKEATSTSENAAPVCIAEGMGWPASTSTVECCSELNKIMPASEQTVDGSCSIKTDSFTCLKCPDGICESTENICNCPQDCATSSIAALGSDSAASTTDAQTDNMAENIDSDNDGLSDGEEAIYRTDPNKSDTDADGFSDGDEVKRGFNPLGPGKLSDIIH